jgi:type II secretory pathway component PulJ
LVSVMVSLALGLVVINLTVSTFNDSLAKHRREVARQRLAQELRGTLDVIVRDLRRAGHWVAPASVSAEPALNPYRHVTLTQESGAVSEAMSRLEYHQSRDEGADNGQINTAGPNESFGIRRVGHTIRSHVTGSWQDLSDPTAAQAQKLHITMTEVEVDQGHLCQQGGALQTSLTSGCCRPDAVDPLQCQARVLVRHADGSVEGAARDVLPGIVVHPNCPQRVLRHVGITLSMRAPVPHDDLQAERHRVALLRADRHDEVKCP